MEASYINLGMGLLLIVVGLLCYRFPNMINPYGNMPPERKALVDIEGLKWSTAIILSVGGGLLILTGLLGCLKVLDENLSGMFLMVICMAMLIPLFIAMRRYNGFGRDLTGKIPTGSDKYSKATARAGKGIWIGIGLTMVFVALLYVMSSHIKITVGEESVKISGMYGREIPASEIVSVELLEQMPSARRINGSDTGRYLTGHFQLKNGEKCMVFVRADMPPFIEMRTTNNLYFLNASDKEKTEEIYEQIKALNP